MGIMARITASTSGCAACGASGAAGGPGGCVACSVNASTHSARMPITLSVVNSDCVPAPWRTPSQLTNVSSRIAAMPTGSSVDLGRCRAWQRYSANTLVIDAITVGLTTHKLAQPNTNPQASPKPSRMNTYRPPVLGCVTASSASASEPQIDSTPPSTQAKMTTGSVDSSCATECGERKMPEPMMFPTVIAVAA